MGMKRAAYFTTAFAIGVTGCALGPRTGNELIDRVVREEAGFHQCISVGLKTTFIEHADDGAPRLGAYLGAFSSDELNNLASEVAVAAHEIDWEALENDNPLVLGEPDTIDGTGSCTMRVTQPAFVKNYAFIEFSAPSGAIGVYAFENTGEHWSVAERVQNGWW